MITFISQALQDLINKKVVLSNITFVVPSKRAGVILKYELSKLTEKTIFSPIIVSIESFTEELSQLQTISNTELLFEFYNTYSELTKKEERDSFEVFSKWAQVLLQDFNEIDRYLIPQEEIFNYLSAIKEIENSEHWSLESNQTDFIKSYLTFWGRLYSYYEHFTDILLSKQIGYQGLIYREAVEHIESYIQNNPTKQHVFLGFNALNAAEEIIIQELIGNELAAIYWDIDQVFFSNQLHDAALFLRDYKNNWRFYKTNTFNWVSNYYSQQKNVNTYAISKNVGQVKHIGSILEAIEHQQRSLDNTAVVLADEELLVPLLNSIPKSIENVNITMGLPLNTIPIASLFELLFALHKRSTESYYYKDIISILTNKFIRVLFKKEDTSIIINTLEDNNLIYISLDRLKTISESHADIIDMFFSPWKTPQKALDSCFLIINAIKAALRDSKSENVLSLEYLYRYNELFNELSRLNEAYNHIQDITTLHSIYKELLSSETLDFKGEPLQGLQIMGMLESRVLDFETVIIASVNEGTLPSGKSNNSFIPYDVKLENKLPTYKEKDAVYTYHFYRLLQRAKTIHILYNSEIDALKGGEKSRFLTQIEIEGIHAINHKIITPKVPVLNTKKTIVKKTEPVLNTLKELAKKGFSPSSLTNYIRNPIDFYYQKILKIKQQEDVEETVAANTLGTVVHNTLEDFYKPIKGQLLSKELILAMKPKIEDTISKHFKEVYKEGDITKGKNLIIFEIAKRYVSNFLNLELDDLKKGNTIKIIDIEADNKIALTIPELNFPVYLTGKVDRVDEYNGTIRIIDYKTGKVDQGKIEIVNWDDITTDYTKYSKSFQVLCYALMMQQKFPVEAGIISFKNLGKGFLKFAKKDAPRSRKKDSLITKKTIENFKTELKKLILEICNPDIDFIEKELK